MNISSSPSPSQENLEGYSAAETLIHFPRPLPLLRGPVKADPSENPSLVPYLLAFKNPTAWAAAYKACEADIITQCESGARIGCSISASVKCKPPWWKIIPGISSKQNPSAREKCEESEMEACFAAAKPKCVDFAKKKCAPAFRDAMIEVSGSNMKEMAGRKDAFRLISRVCFANERRYVDILVGVDTPWEEVRRVFEVTCVRGSDLLSSDEVSIEDYWRRRSSSS